MDEKERGRCTRKSVRKRQSRNRMLVECSRILKIPLLIWVSERRAKHRHWDLYPVCGSCIHSGTWMPWRDPGLVTVLLTVMPEKSPSSSFGTLHSLYLYSLSVLLPLYVPGPFYVPAFFVYTRIICMYLCHLYVPAFFVCITCTYLYPLSVPAPCVCTCITCLYLHLLSVLLPLYVPGSFVCTCVICMYLLPLYADISSVLVSDIWDEMSNIHSWGLEASL